MEIDTLHHGDCITLLPDKTNIGSIDLVYADPPYNLSGSDMRSIGSKTGGNWHKVNEEWDRMPESDYRRFTREWILACARALKLSGSFFISCSFHNIADIIQALRGSGFKINNIITWHKTNPMPNLTRRVFTHSTEFVIWAVKGGKWTFNYEVMREINPNRKKQGTGTKQMDDLWEFPLVQGAERIKNIDGRAAHPTQKPEKLVTRIIMACSNEGDIVLDPFMGSGTTAVAAIIQGRKWIGFEKEESYLQIAKRRIADVQSGPQQLL